MKKNIFSVKKIWHNLDLKVKYCYEIIKALVADEQSRQSYNLVSLFSSLQHYINQLLKMLKEEKGEEKNKQTNLISVLF